MRQDLLTRREVRAPVGVAWVTMLVLAAPAGFAESVLKPRGYEQVVLNSHPVAYWPLNDTKKMLPLAKDATGHKHDGKYVNNPTFTFPGVCLDGPKSKAYVEVPDDRMSKSFSVASSGKGLTVEVWMKPEVLDFRGENEEAYVHWLGKGEAEQYEWGFRFYSKESKRPNYISAYIWNLKGCLGAGAYVKPQEVPLKEREWIHLVATFDDPNKPNARVQIYANAVPSKHNSSPGTLYSNYKIKPAHGTAPIRLGARDQRGFLTGCLADVAIYKRVLPLGEIQAHHQAGINSGRFK